MKDRDLIYVHDLTDIIFNISTGEVTTVKLTSNVTGETVGVFLTDEILEERELVLKATDFVLTQKREMYDLSSPGETVDGRFGWFIPTTGLVSLAPSYDTPEVYALGHYPMVSGFCFAEIIEGKLSIFKEKNTFPTVDAQALEQVEKQLAAYK